MLKELYITTEAGSRIISILVVIGLWLGQNISFAEPADEFQHCFNRAKRLYEDKKYEEAIKVYEEAIKITATEPAPYYNIACCYSLLNKTEEALTWFEKSLAHGFLDYAHIKQDADFDNIRNGPGFKKLLSHYESKANEAKQNRFPTEKITIKDGDTILSGILVLPEADVTKPYPAILLVHGSGPALGAQFMGLMRYFASQGFAALIWDKPGCGKSTGDWGEQNFNARANEVLAAINDLKKVNFIDPKRIGLWGISQGGWILPLAASMSTDVAFLIPISGPGITPKEQGQYANEHFFKASGLSEKDVERAKDFMATFDKLAQEDAPTQKVFELIEKFKNDAWFRVIAPAVGDFSKAFAFSKNLARENYDPVAILEKVRCPVLAIWGEEDMLVPAQKSKEIFEQALKKADNKDVTLKIFLGADHGIIDKTTGKVADGFLQTMGNWLKKRFGNKEKIGE